MPSATPSSEFDLIGLGFGPSNLALAIALSEQAPQVDALFLERRARFAWHPDMLLDGARMQVSFLKDLATLRNPRSEFTFVNYLWQRGRLDEFINVDTSRPSRVEFDDYLGWAAEAVADRVRYGRSVLEVSPVLQDGFVDVLEVRSRCRRTGRERVDRTRNVVLAAGGEPRIPDGITVGRRIFHSCDYRTALDQLDLAPDAAAELVVVGEGQSAAEILLDLMTRHPNARLTAVLPGLGYRPMDDSPFVNEVFFPSRVDAFYALDEERRRRELAAVRNTNYSVVDADLIERLYARLYDRRVVGDRRVELRPRTLLRAASRTGERVDVTLESRADGRRTTVSADGLVLATGYRAATPHRLLAPLEGHLELDDSGRYAVRRDYRVRARNEFRPGIYLQGYCQTTHGIAETLLSIAAVRAGEICDAVAATLPAERRPVRARRRPARGEHRARA